MNPHIQVKEEYPTAGGAIGSSSSLYGEVPQPLEGLHDMGPPPFLTKTYEIVDDPRTDPIVSWSRGNNSFVVWDAQAFSASLLPRYFKHNNFSSFIRQLNTYGFRKVDPDRWEFANEGFLRGQKHLLKNIRRRRATQAPQNVHQTLDPCVEVGRFGIDGEMDRLKRDKQILMMELIKLRQQQQTSRSYLQVMEERLKRTESKQHQMMNFLARAIKNPDFLQQLVQQKDQRKELEEVFGKKKRQRPIDQGPSNVDICDDEVQDLGTSVKVDHQTFGEMPETEALELANIAVDVVGGYFVGGSHSSVEIDQIGVAETNQVTGKAINDERFWEDLLNEGSEKEVDLFSVRGEEEEEDVNVLVEQLGDLGSTP